MFARRLARCAAAAFVAVTLNASISSAECKPDTATTNRTLISGIAAFHFDEVGTSITVNDKQATMVGGEFALALCRWPAYTIAFGGDFMADAIETSYVAPGSTDYHPNLLLGSTSVTVTRRWRNSEIIHPFVSLRAGAMNANYTYFHRVNGLSEKHVDGQSSAGFAAPSVGAEISLFKYVTAYLAGGQRFAGQLDTPGLNSSISGPFVAFGMGFGKFR